MYNLFNKKYPLVGISQASIVGRYSDKNNIFSAAIITTLLKKKNCDVIINTSPIRFQGNIQAYSVVLYFVFVFNSLVGPQAPLKRGFFF